MQPRITDLHNVYSSLLHLFPNVPPSLLSLARMGLGGMRPIPITSRLPEVGECDGRGRCWCHKDTNTHELNNWELRKLRLSPYTPPDSHWMPYWAISNLA